jgi:hypothetical protein
MEQEKLEEVRKVIACKKEIMMPKTYKASSIEDVQQMAANLPTLEEGYVCYVPLADKVRKAWRLKVKNLAFLVVAHSKIKGALNSKRIINIIWAGEYQEYLTYFPQDSAVFQPYVKAYHMLEVFIADCMEVLSYVVTMKDFAIVVNSNELLKTYSYFLFGLKQGKSKTFLFDSFAISKRVDILTHVIDKIMPDYHKVIMGIKNERSAKL